MGAPCPAMPCPAAKPTCPALPPCPAPAPTLSRLRISLSPSPASASYTAPSAKGWGVRAARIVSRTTAHEGFPSTARALPSGATSWRMSCALIATACLSASMASWRAPAFSSCVRRRRNCSSYRRMRSRGDRLSQPGGAFRSGAPRWVSQCRRTQASLKPYLRATSFRGIPAVKSWSIASFWTDEQTLQGLLERFGLTWGGGVSAAGASGAPEVASVSAGAGGGSCVGIPGRLRLYGIRDNPPTVWA